MTRERRQGRVAHQRETMVRRRHEFCALGAKGDVFARRPQPLAGIAVEQRIAGVSLQHQRQLPRQIPGVIQTRIKAADAKNRHQMRCVPGKQDAAVSIAGERETFGVVYRNP